MSELSPLKSSEVDQLLAQHPDLPIEYLDYLRDFGWGESLSGHMIYSGPIIPTEVYPNWSEDHKCVLIGDDMHGYCLAYSFSLGTFGEISDFGEWTEFDKESDLAVHLNEN